MSSCYVYGSDLLCDCLSLVFLYKCREKQFVLRHQWTNDQARLYCNVEENQGVNITVNHLSKDDDGEGSNDERDKETEEEDYDGEESHEEEGNGTEEEENRKKKEMKVMGQIVKNRMREEKGKESKECKIKERRKDGKREEKLCPVPNCDAKVIHLPKHLRNVHKWQKEYVRTALARFRLRKKYEFVSQKTVYSRNRRPKSDKAPFLYKFGNFDL